jgi:hypothetical protein
MKLIISVLVCLLLLAKTTFIWAQAPGGKLFVLSEGTTEKAGEIGVVDFSTGKYTRVNSIAAFGNYLYHLDSLVFAVSGDGTIYVYHDQLGTLLDSIPNVAGARRVSYWNGQLLVSSSVSPYFRAYSWPAKTLLYSLDTTKIRTPAEGIAVAGNKAFVTLGYYRDSIVAVIDLVRQDTTKMISVDVNPIGIELRKGKMIVECANFFPMFGSFQLIDTTTLSVTQTFKLPFSMGYSTFTADNDSLIYLTDGNDGSIATLNYQTGYLRRNYVPFTLAPYYALHYNTNSNSLFASVNPVTFSDTGTVGVIFMNSFQFPVKTYINPRAVLFAPLRVISSNQRIVHAARLKIFPNPANNWLQLASDEILGDVELLDMTGKIVLKSNNLIAKETMLDISNLPGGLYYIKNKAFTSPVLIKH